jgi:hypothetical protein
VGLEARAYLVAVCDSGVSCERITQRPPMHSNPLTVVDQAVRAGWRVGTDEKGHFLTYCADTACLRKAMARFGARHAHAVSETECDPECDEGEPHGFLEGDA